MYRHLAYTLDKVGKSEMSLLFFCLLVAALIQAIF